jgi:hypothetical protein
MVGMLTHEVFPSPLTFVFFISLSFVNQLKALVAVDGITTACTE